MRIAPNSSFQTPSMGQIKRKCLKQLWRQEIASKPSSFIPANPQIENDFFLHIRYKDFNKPIKIIQYYHTDPFLSYVTGIIDQSLSFFYISQIL